MLNALRYSALSPIFVLSSRRVSILIAKRGAGIVRKPAHESPALSDPEGIRSKKMKATTENCREKTRSLHFDANGNRVSQNGHEAAAPYDPWKVLKELQTDQERPSLVYPREARESA